MLPHGGPEAIDEILELVNADGKGSGRSDGSRSLAQQPVGSLDRL